MRARSHGAVLESYSRNGGQCRAGVCADCGCCTGCKNRRNQRHIHNLASLQPVNVVPEMVLVAVLPMLTDPAVTCPVPALTEVAVTAPAQNSQLHAEREKHEQTAVESNRRDGCCS